MPSLFTHVETSGCSVQREHLATDAELSPWVRTFLLRQSKQSWFGTVSALSSDIRKVNVSQTSNRALAVYDTAEPKNPAHAEIFQTQYVVDEADQAELRREIMKAFGGGAITKPDQYRSGAIWQGLGQDIQSCTSTA